MILENISRKSIRFEFSPIQEVLRAMRVLVDPRRHAEQMDWVRSARRRATPTLKRELQRFAFLLFPAPELFPELFPHAKSPAFGDELDHLRNNRRGFRESMLPRMIAKPLFLRSDVTSRIRSNAMQKLCEVSSSRSPEVALEALCELLGEFFERCLSRHWEVFEERAIADARAREVLMDRFGITSMLRTLTRHITARGSRRVAALSIGEREAIRQPLSLQEGGSLKLTPSYFIWPHATILVLRRVDLDVRIAYPLASPSSVRPRATAWEPLAKRFAALADPTRLQMLDLLSERDLSTREFAGLVGLSEGGVSRHLSILRQAELVTSVRDGYFVLYRRTPLADAYFDPRGITRL